MPFYEDIWQQMAETTGELLARHDDLIDEGAVRFLYAELPQVSAQEFQIICGCVLFGRKETVPFASLNVESDKADIASARDRKGRRRFPILASSPFAVDQPVLNGLADRLTNVTLDGRRHGLPQCASKSAAAGGT